ncbi:MAG: LpqB family beta-propeller domain-containing protein [Cellulomonas sp.]
MSARPLADRSRSRGHGRVLGALVGALVALVLAGCAGLPTSGAVGDGDGAAAEPGTVFPLAYSPAVGADPRAIVQGFLAAGAAGLGDNYAVARQYLARESRTSWLPTKGVVVYSAAAALDFQQVTETQIRVTLPVVATVDADGRYSEGFPGATQDAVFDLVQDSDGQWRISGLDDGVLLSEPFFYSVYGATPLYFLTPTRDMLVPEERWFPRRNAATYAVRALLEGPSAWLRDAVTTAFPDGTRLAVESVPVDTEGNATVDLTSAVTSASSEDRALLKAQLFQVLQLPRIRAVKVTIAGVPMVDPPAATLLRDPAPGGGLQVISDGLLQGLTGSTLKPVETVAPLAGLDPRSPAAGVDNVPEVLLSGAGQLVLAPTPTTPAVGLVTGSALLAPSVDRVGWVWTGPSPSGGLVAARPDGTVVDVAVDWLEGRTVRSVRVSRDATRIAVISTGPDGVTVDVAGIVRDDSGTPQRLGERLRVGAPLLTATAVVWVDQVTLAVLGTSGAMTGPTMHLVPIAGDTQALPALDGAVSIAAGKGERALFVGTTGGSLFTLQGNGWLRVATNVTYPAFPG